MKNKLCIYILFLLLGCMACNFSSTQGQYKTLANETWERDSNYKLEFNISQPGSYQLSTCIRHSTDYKQRNISCYLTIRHQGLEVDKKNSDIILVDNNGKWIGQGLTGLKTVVQPIDRIFHFDSTGIYTVEIKHRMKDNQLTGIKNIGIKIKSTTYYGEK